MKKLLLVATLGVAGFMSANSYVSNSICTQNNEKKENSEDENTFRKCSVFVTFYGSGGQVIGHDSYSSDQSSLGACQEWQQAKIKFLQALGYIITVG